MDESEDRPASDDDESAPKRRRGRPLGATDWKPWEDRALAHEAQAMEMWRVGRRGKKSKSKWNELAVAIASKNPMFGRVGSACKARLYALLKHEKNIETRALQTTGEGDDIDNHLEVMTDLLSRFRDFEQRKEEDDNANKAKAELEKAAGAEMRKAAMTDLVHRETLTDLSRVKGSTAREKGGQRTERKRAKSDENTHCKKARTGPSVELKDMIEARNASDKAALKEAMEIDQARHNETKSMLEGLTGELQELTHLLKEDFRQRTKDEKARRAENKALWSVVKAAVQK
ncbi:hypothetical protein RhiJN_11943 [Ceratobasidium sp. AG-Ba]|nr:hypothetical protein RhiJN_11943 [Ceratobasidium sp. AG-Ba]